jgi:hypothetical protein
MPWPKVGPVVVVLKLLPVRVSLSVSLMAAARKVILPKPDSSFETVLHRMSSRCGLPVYARNQLYARSLEYAASPPVGGCQSLGVIVEDTCI